MNEQRFFASAARNLESLLADELRGLGIESAVETRAGVDFSGSLADAYRVCLWSRIASRVLLPLSDFAAPDPDALYAGVREIDWSEHLGPEQTLAVSVDSARSQIEHTQFAAQRIKDAIVDQIRERSGSRPSVRPIQPDLALRCRLFRDQAVLFLDLSGEALHRRGWRIQGGAAPLKETLAAALLLRAGWPEIAAGGGELLDPLCGIGTLVIEGALIAADIAPGLRRDYWGFSGWRGHDQAAWSAWRTLLAEAKERRATGLHRLARSSTRLRGSDLDPAAIKAAHANASHAGLAGHVQFERQALEDCRPSSTNKSANATASSGTDTSAGTASEAEPVTTASNDSRAAKPITPAGSAEHASNAAPIPGLLITNPPYGERIGAEDLAGLYQSLGVLLRSQFEGWRAAVLTGNPELGKRMGLRAHRFHTLYNGPIECRLLHFDVRPEAHVSDRPRPLPPAERGPGAEMLANRLRKNQKALRKWLQREGIRCYRLYDADLPEYALAVDLYQSANPATPERRFVQVQEYAAPPDIDPKAARRRLREGIGVIAEVLEVPEHDLFFKVRQPQRGKAQYERLAQTGHFHKVAEDELTLLVNFEDYLDTGLFLDHRETRRLIGHLAADRNMLNLFGYTGVASCHAAQGGARSTTTVDLSKTYLDWARRNLALNGFTGHDHQLIQANCLEWLEQARAYRGHFGLIFLDPPTFSSSKRMEGTFEVERDQVRLIRAAVALLAPDGELIFSTNKRRFKLDEEALSNLDIEDISAQTIPKDFARHPHIHRCWRIRRRQ
ncbi:bifunctional 23S rRNA (guanine(2069)-N(7))-methyltransferase RlmK/23S rRNA (guanine(2445)-N(2))-methyltransferase RlmL [Lamprobacter modestohalophilus]|uniref:bifunctional 23S rRNA (guanine(2069)-N(7))-methyltransferase RlmK/23S rRNA (guanine(2445)-N(2))-methyltransferase RlmL n=1 Tax=Lamprobacter modestohalophilus TaxID=1064514 RepID=UPI002ADEC065|nr:bifunctional 23S rRNA (guanine(2069)-N(7))-methyltransferase RlmK/23S rRNA (guanine(2445)-N(2))-methyltransferase RlmL [Lamprobacter modestohalophilus]MEA1048766.1 bifunctional 23S rRNA (guanine(2069)-N(7))-methyltransferase RlmK/23S rRNA (guanine(2445)-N(2))-methyltransferase RlmL [Lamprobacter modestohalophilus]